jgi:hypothetical protein
MVVNYTNIFHSKALNNLPKLEFSVWKYTIWQPWCAPVGFSVIWILKLFRFVRIILIPVHACKDVKIYISKIANVRHNVGCRCHPLRLLNGWGDVPNIKQNAGSGSLMSSLMCALSRQDGNKKKHHIHRYCNGQIHFFYVNSLMFWSSYPVWYLSDNLATQHCRFESRALSSLPSTSSPMFLYLCIAWNLRSFYLGLIDVELQSVTPEKETFNWLHLGSVYKEH